MKFTRQQKLARKNADLLKKKARTQKFSDCYEFDSETQMVQFPKSDSFAFEWRIDSNSDFWMFDELSRSRFKDLEDKAIEAEDERTKVVAETPVKFDLDLSDVEFCEGEYEYGGFEYGDIPCYCSWCSM